MTHKISRREFVTRTAVYGGSLVVGLQLPRPRALKAAQESTQPVVLSSGQWRTVEAISGDTTAFSNVSQTKGTDADVTVNGQSASVDGLDVSYNGAGVSV